MCARRCCAHKIYRVRILSRFLRKGGNHGRGHLSLSSELMYFPAITFRWSTLRRRAEYKVGFTFLRQLQPQFTARFGFPIERLCNRRRTTHFAQKQDFYFEISRLSLNVQQVANVYLACRFGRLLVGLNPAEITHARSQSARLKESRCPQPLIHTNSRHNFDSRADSRPRLSADRRSVVTICFEPLM